MVCEGCRRMNEREKWNEVFYHAIYGMVWRLVFSMGMEGTVQERALPNSHVLPALGLSYATIPCIRYRVPQTKCIVDVKSLVAADRRWGLNQNSGGFRLLLLLLLACI